MLCVMWRGMETGSQTSLAGNEGGNPGYRQGMFLQVTASALDPTRENVVEPTKSRLDPGLSGYGRPEPSSEYTAQI